MSTDKQRGIRVSQEELLCKNACGYYGNPAWKGFCSKCWRERSRPPGASRQDARSTLWSVTFEPRPRRSILSVLFNNQLTATPFRPSSDGAPPTFSKFEEKKNIEKGSRYNTVRRLFWGSSSPPKPQGRSDNFLYSYIVSSVPQSLDFPDLSETSSIVCLFRVLGKPCTHVKSLSESWAWRLPWLFKDPAESTIPAHAVALYCFPQHNGSLPCNYCTNVNFSHFKPLSDVKTWFIYAGSADTETVWPCAGFLPIFCWIF